MKTLRLASLMLMLMLAFVLCRAPKPVAAQPAVNYALTVNTAGAGTVTKSPDAPDYAPGAVVTLTATPALTSTFMGWSGAVTGFTNPVTVTMSAAKAVTATFATLLTYPQREPFTSAATNNTCWKFLGNARLTSGGVDPAGNGWLRLTDALNGQAGTAICDQPLSTAQGFVAQFQYATYGGSGADGFTFYLLDGTTLSPTVGATGGALGYAGSGGTPGVTTGYVGIGFDEYGNYSLNTVGSGGVGQRTHSVVVRGSGSLLTGFNYLTGIQLGQLTPPPASTRIDSVTRASARWVRVFIADQKITVQMDFGTGYRTVIDAYNLATASGQAALPATFKLGFSSSTGGSTNIHELRNLTVAQPALMTLTNTDNRTAITTGSQQVYTVTVANDNRNDVVGATLTDVVPAGVTNVNWSCTAAVLQVAARSAGQMLTGCGVASGSGNVISVPVTLLKNGIVQLVITGTVSAAGGATLTNTVGVTPPDYILNVALTDTAVDTTTVLGRTALYMPLLFQNFDGLPDLVVRSLTASANAVQVVIQNQGQGPAVDDFWVDVYLNPATAPTGVNEHWWQLGDHGLVWLVPAATTPLKAGQVFTLTVGDANFDPAESDVVWPLAAGDPVYAQVDSINPATTYGAILEAHEALGAAYNNFLATKVTP